MTKNVSHLFFFFSFLIEQSQLVISDVTTRVKLLGYISETGEPLRQYNNVSISNVSIVSIPRIEYRIDLIRDQLKNVTEKGTQRYLSDHLQTIESVVTNLK